MYGNANPRATVRTAEHAAQVGRPEHPEEATAEVAVGDSYYCHFNPHFSKITATINSYKLKIVLGITLAIVK